jgi:hypothetical protein
MDDEKLDKLLEYIKPANSFENTDHPIAPDYSNYDNWAAYPDKDGQQFYLPDSSLAINKINNDVDVFYIHPTGFFLRKHGIRLWKKTELHMNEPK